MSSDAYAGVRRGKQTPWRVKFGDALVSKLITIGGMGTIAAVLLVVLVLLATAWPLLRSPSVSKWQVTQLAGDALESLAVPSQIRTPCGSDEFGLMNWQLLPDGRIVIHATGDGAQIAILPSPAGEGRQITCHSLSVDRNLIALGFSDGSFQTATLKFATELLVAEQLPAGVLLDADHPRVVHEQAVYELFGTDSIRKLAVSPLSWSSPEKIAAEPLLAIDYAAGDATNQFSQSTVSTLAAIAGKSLIIASIESRENLMTGAVSNTVTTQSCPAEIRSEQPPLGLMLANRGMHVIVAWDTGTLDRYALTSSGPRSLESASGLPGGGKFTAAATMLARQTLVLGDAAGTLHGWNIIQASSENNIEGAASDGYRLTATHEVALSAEPILSINSSGTSHLAIVTSQSGQTSLVMTTTDSLLKQIAPPKELVEPARLAQAFLTPKNDGIVALAGTHLVTAPLDVAYPEASLRALFGKVWYEGHAEPKYIWQSSAGTEQSEPKLSLIPLVFGTLKATLYAMVFSVPLALLAAIYTSEFLTPGLRSRVKPIIELMASLPSVILGFIAALVLAPLLQQHLCAVLLAIFVIPVTFIYAAHLWNLLPLEFLVRAHVWRLWFLILCMPIALLIAFSLAPIVEHWLFADNIAQWMWGSVGNAVGGWMLLLLPVVSALATFLMLGPLAQWNRQVAINMSPKAYALRGVVQLIVVTACVVVATYGLSLVLAAAGMDLRSSLFTGYQERNSLLVGAVLGFCVIPLIYTLAEDALQSVPQQLRSASLGCGATPWQTTVRVVVPSAMSGMFSAIMIGFGRAVGETMVVLMAAGNTPIMEWNPFNGFRTLSATLATELPEAAKGSTHFRTLFLAALLLFTLTLVANTLAEYVRIRFRRRGSQL